MLKTPILILLAAGNSSRMGFPKGLLIYKNKPWILEQISRYKSVENPKIVIVLGNDIEFYFKQIHWFQKALNNYYDYNGVNVKILHNKNTKLGSFSSLKLALSIINKDNEILVQPIDVPLLDSQNLQKLIQEKNTIVIPKCDSKNGHPVKLKPLFWNGLLEIEETSNKERLDYKIKDFDTKKISYLKVNNPLIYANMNTKDAWKKFLTTN